MQSVLITGGNSGLGYQCARVIAAAQPQWHVVLASRDRAKTTEAARSLTAETGNANIVAAELDLASQESVRRLAASLKAAPPLSAIVCNAGMQFTDLKFTAEGNELTFAVNHLGHFLLVNLLLSHLSPPARIVVVGSATHDPEQFTGMPKPDYRHAQNAAKPELDVDAGTAGRRAYTTSKLCNMMFAYELSRQLSVRGDNAITVNAFDPGLMPGTGLARDYGSVQKFFWRFALPVLRLLPGVNSTSRSGENLARLVLDPTLEGTSGKYFVGRKAVASSKESYDEAKASELWASSLEMVSLA